MRECVERLYNLSQQVATGQGGREFSIVEDEPWGYEETPLELAFQECS
ncbi:MAG: hypothetical protein JW934_17725 [Anaerolineae bacterium]|nr:hypothetical protein [Anaerolineae bacterium]